MSGLRQGRIAPPETDTTAQGVEGVFRGPVDLAGLEAGIEAVDPTLEGAARRAEVRRVAALHGVAVYFADVGGRPDPRRVLVVDDVGRPGPAVAFDRSDEPATCLTAVRREQAEERARRGWNRGSVRQVNRLHEGRLRQFAKRR